MWGVTVRLMCLLILRPRPPRGNICTSCQCSNSSMVVKINGGESVLLHVPQYAAPRFPYLPCLAGHVLMLPIAPRHETLWFPIKKRPPKKKIFFNGFNIKSRKNKIWHQHHLPASGLEMKIDLVLVASSAALYFFFQNIPSFPDSVLIFCLIYFSRCAPHQTQKHYEQSSKKFGRKKTYFRFFESIVNWGKGLQVF